MKMRRFIATILVAVMLVSVLSSAVMASEVSRETVQEVQQALNDAGFDCGTPDGAAGDKTKKAISEYQQANGLEVTGEISDELLAALFPVEETEVSTEDTSEIAETGETEEDVYLIDANGKYSGVTDEGHEFEWYSNKKIIFSMDDGDFVYEIGAHNGYLVIGRLNEDMTFNEDTISILSMDRKVLSNYAERAYEVWSTLISKEEYYEENFVESTEKEADYIEFEAFGTNYRWLSGDKFIYVLNEENVYQISLLNGDLVFGKLNEDGESFKWYTSLTAMENFSDIMDSAFELMINECLGRYVKDKEE